VHSPENDPLIFLQSLDDQSLCFITIPILAVDAQYQLRMSNEDLEVIGLNPAHQPRIGDDVLCLGVLSIKETGPTANLLAPLVVHQRTHKGVQAIAPESDYPHDFLLLPPAKPKEELTRQEAVVC
jgi:flagellar assembly factor FliW